MAILETLHHSVGFLAGTIDLIVLFYLDMLQDVFIWKWNSPIVSHPDVWERDASSLVLAPVGLLSFMRIYFLLGHKEMKGLRTGRNLSETTAPLEIRPKTRELSWWECREEKKREGASLKKTKGPVSPAERGDNSEACLLSLCSTPLAFALHSSQVICLYSWWETSLWPQQLLTQMFTLPPLCMSTPTQSSLSPSF